MRRARVCFAATLVLVACGTNSSTGAAGAVGVNPGADAATSESPSALSDIGLPTVRRVEAGKIYAVDEASQLPDLVSFRQNLLDIVRRRDGKALLTHIDPNIEVGFGTDDSVEAFDKVWRVSTGEASDNFWGWWEDALRGGGLVVTPTYPGADAQFDFPAAPRLYSGNSPGEDVFAIGEGVNVRSAPELDAPIVAQVSYEILPRAQGAPDVEDPMGPESMIEGRGYLWTEVRLKDNRTGYISNKFLSSPVAHGGSMVRRDGKWKVVRFYGGL